MLFSLRIWWCPRKFTGKLETVHPRREGSDQQDQLTSEQRKGLETRFSLSPSGLLLNRLFQLFLKTWISSQSLCAGFMLTSMSSHRSCLGTGQDFGLGGEQKCTTGTTTREHNQREPPRSPQSPTCCPPFLGAGGPKASPAQGGPSNGAAVAVLCFWLSCSRKHPS